MARSHGRSAAALAVGVLSALGNAQGYYGGDQSTCDSSDAFVDIGCFSGNNQPLYTPFIVENYDPAALTNSFPGYVGLDNNFNSTVTPLACTTVCRGYGYRTASLRNNVCACGYGVPDPYPPTLSGDCSVPCAGDASQLCGGAVDTRIFLDPSFADPNALATAGAPALAEYYQYLGCFNQESSFPTNDAGNTIIVVDSIEVCLERCAAIRYPLARATKTGNQVTCDCGETFNPDDYRIVEDDELPAGSCNVGCVTGYVFSTIRIS
ncbi:hypothetical protein GE09DRAFT_567957 [Coniochaeta sp. 2T2.1]|nr:hypothetical protein GE09DRAFT_567957 [Coniochaeta sp. 2T2.1]